MRNASRYNKVRVGEFVRIAHRSRTGGQNIKGMSQGSRGGMGLQGKKECKGVESLVQDQREKGC